MIRRIKDLSPAMVVAIVALIAAVAGTSFAGVATISALNKGEKKQVKKIVKKTAYAKADADARFLQGAEVLTSQATATNLLANFQPNGAFTSVLNHSVTVPSAGTLLIWGSVALEDGNDTSTPVESRLRVDSTQAGVIQQSVVQVGMAFPLGFYSTSMTPIGRATVGAGAHSLDLDVRNQEAGDIAVEERSIMTQFIPN